MLYRFLFLILVCLSPVYLSAQDSTSSNEKSKNDLMKLDGVLVCITEEMAKLRDIKPSCKEYGHIVGMRVSDGTIWSFYPNPLQKELKDNNLIGKKIRITGRLFYDGKIIQIAEYQFTENKESKKP